MSRPTLLRTIFCGPNPIICTRDLDGPDGVLVAQGGHTRRMSDRGLRPMLSPRWLTGQPHEQPKPDPSPQMLPAERKLQHPRPQGLKPRTDCALCANSERYIDEWSKPGSKW